MRPAPRTRRTRGGRPWSALPCLVALLLSSLPAVAEAGEDEAVLAVEPGWGLFSSDDTAHHAVGGSLSGWVGVTELLWLSGSAGTFRALGDAPRDGAQLWDAYGGVVAALDVLRTIPFFEVQIGVTGRDTTLAPGVRFGLGADYLVSRSISLGAIVRWRSLTEDIAEGGLLTAQFRVALRLEL